MPHAKFDNEAQDAKLAALREKEEEDLAQVLSSRYGLTYTDLGVVPIGVEALRLVPEEKAKEAQAIAFAKVAKQVSVAMHNPGNPAVDPLLADLESRGFILTKFLVSTKSINKGIARYADLAYAHSSETGTFDISGDELTKLSQELTTLAALRARLTTTLAEKKGAQVSKIFEQVLAAAFVMKASDIHIEPEEEDVRLRLRIDGILTDTFSFDNNVHRYLNSRIKLLSGLKLNVDNRAQDGRFTVVLNGAEIEIRTSVIPGNYGESVVLRLLDPRTIQKALGEIGINDKLLSKLKNEIRRPTGMLLNTGPTGSGKTTSLYTFMREIHSPEIKIVTIEDPVEYHVQGIVQTQVGKDYTFASGLRSVLRQDPDVIMVGEIRDAEVAETAMQAALTGHFVFSTLHTNNAAGTFPRLVDLGIDPKVFASAVTVAMAQRLVRTLDEATKKARPITPEEKVVVETVLSTLTDRSLIPASMDTVYDAVSDGEGSTGYKGRMGIHEAIFMDEQLGEFLRDNPSENDISKHVLRQGYPTLAQDGILKILQGKTTFEELRRVVDLPT